MIRLHPVTRKQEVAVDVKVAAIVAVDLNTKSLHDRLLVQVVTDPAKGGVAQVSAVLTVTADIVDIAASALVGADQGIVAVNGSRDASPDAPTLIAALDESLAPRQGIVHAAALALAKDSRIAAITASHWAIVSILSKSIGQAVANQDRLEVDIAVLVRQNLGSEDRDVVASVRFACNVEVLRGILWELVEEQGQESIHILGSSNGVAHR